MNTLNYRTYSDLAKDIRQCIGRMPSGIDLIVGNPRSGMIPAHMIAAYLNLPVASLDEYLSDIVPSTGARPVIVNNNTIKKVLIVDDSVNSGTALQKVRTRLAAKTGGAGVEYIFFGAYVTSAGKNFVDLYAVVCEKPRLFQWNYLYHDALTQACVDIDGILCVDPTPEQNDDGPAYTGFIQNARPLYIPNYRIRALVTSRLEKYRPQTEAWLAKNHVVYDDLFMLDLPSREERIKQKAHGKFKAEVYGRLNDCTLFIESERDQAVYIAKSTGKPVICLHTDEMFQMIGSQLYANDVAVDERLSKKSGAKSFFHGLLKKIKGNQ